MCVDINSAMGLNAMETGLVISGSNQGCEPAFVRWSVVALMVSFSVMNYFDRTIIAIAGPGIMQEYRLTETQMGSIYSAFLLGYALFMIPGGYLADRYGPRAVVTVMGLGAALSTGLTGFGGRPGLGAYLGIVPAFAVIRFGMGAFTAPLYPACGATNANWFPLGRRALVWGLVAGGAGLGGAIAPPIFSRTIERFGWRQSFWLAGAATALLALIWLWYVRDHPSEHPSLRRQGAGEAPAPRPAGSDPQTGSASWRRLLTNRNMALLSFGYLTAGYFEYIFFYWIYYYFGQIRRLPAAETTLYTTLIFVSWTVMTPLGGAISDRLVKRYGKKRGRRIVPIVSLTAAALCLGVGASIANAALAAGVMALALGLASCSDGPFWACAIDIGDGNAGAACGILNTGGNIGGTVCPVLTPFIASFAGWSVALYFGCLVAILGVSIWFFVDTTGPE